MADDLTQGRLQRIEDHVRRLDERVSVLSLADGDTVRKRIHEAIEGDPRRALVFRGVQRGMTQAEIANVLRSRGLPGARQQRVSDTLNEFIDTGFVRRARGGFVTRDLAGWNEFGLERYLKKVLKKHKIDDIP